MGLNNYAFYDKQEVDSYTTMLNRQRISTAEEALIAATQALTDTMNPMPGAENQEIGRMEVEVGEGHFLTMLTRDLGRQHDRPMKALDIGTFTGHSAGAMAKGMEENNGKVITCDVSDKYSHIAEQYWKDEGIRDRIDYKVIPCPQPGEGGAVELLQKLVSDPHELGTFDIVFIDADKPGYAHYYEQALKLLRPGGKIVLDNMLWSGRVTNPELHDANTDAIRDLNTVIFQDKRVDAVMVNADDGIVIAEKLGMSRRLNRPGVAATVSR